MSPSLTAPTGGAKDPWRHFPAKEFCSNGKCSAVLLRSHSVCGVLWVPAGKITIMQINIEIERENKAGGERRGGAGETRLIALSISSSIEGKIKSKQNQTLR